MALMATAITSDHLIQGKHLNGYIQHISAYKQLAIANFAEIQLSCIKAVDYENRYLHVDATGNLARLQKRINLPKSSTSIHYLSIDRS